MRTPQEHYQHYVDNEKICTDNHQKSAIKALQQEGFLLDPGGIRTMGFRI